MGWDFYLHHFFLFLPITGGKEWILFLVMNLELPTLPTKSDLLLYNLLITGERRDGFRLFSKTLVQNKRKLSQMQFEPGSLISIFHAVCQPLCHLTQTSTWDIVKNDFDLFIVSIYDITKIYTLDLSFPYLFSWWNWKSFSRI